MQPEEGNRAGDRAERNVLWRAAEDSVHVAWRGV